ncbi:hypothetical protein SAMN05421739_11049 [Pontibacter chinhatensis]|uniref:Uncharacterized protein n=1 Tax=Pontibacter chinhatensis TaxID=1436961 RepID=A0A1I2YWQ0_9BACT|nr:hypothetical protein SAMN05421739_11049 [Pontibacter chinhatensis]
MPGTRNLLRLLAREGFFIGLYFRSETSPNYLPPTLYFNKLT